MFFARVRYLTLYLSFSPALSSCFILSPSPLFTSEDFFRERGFSSGLRDVSHCSSLRRNFCAKPGPSLTLYLFLSLSHSPTLTLPLACVRSFSVLGKREER